MKSLAERHAERAQRKADNAAFSNNGESKGNLGLAMVRMNEAQEAFANLTDEEREELKASFDGFESSDDATNLYDATGSLKSAGVGVVNPLIVPAAAMIGTDAADAGVAADGWGTLPEPNATPEQGNQNGAALEAQTSAESASPSARTARSKAKAPEGE